MKFATKIAALAISGLILVAACKKKEDTTTTVTKTKKENLQDGKWQITSMPVTYTYTTPFGTQTQSYNNYDSMMSCDKDDFTFFKSWGKVYMDQGATKCNTSDPQIDSTATWTLNSGDTKLTMPMDGMAMTFDVQTLTGTDLKLYNNYDTSYTMSGITISINYKTTVEFKNKN
jgi:hypothetical protein